MVGLLVPGSCAVNESGDIGFNLGSESRQEFTCRQVEERGRDVGDELAKQAKKFLASIKVLFRECITSYRYFLYPLHLSSLQYFLLKASRLHRFSLVVLYCLACFYHTSPFSIGHSRLKRSSRSLSSFTRSSNSGLVGFPSSKLRNPSL